MARTRTVRRLVVAGITAALVLVPAGSAFACGALLAPNGTISLTRTNDARRVPQRCRALHHVVRVRREDERGRGLDHPAAGDPKRAAGA